MGSTGTFDACFTHQFKLNYLETEKVAIGHSVSSEVFSACGHLWRIICNPRGDKNGQYEYVSIFLEHQHESKSKATVKATFEAFLMEKDGNPSSGFRRSVLCNLEPKGSTTNESWGWLRFAMRLYIKMHYLINGSFIITCTFKVVLDDDPFEVPPSDMGRHLGLLLDSAEGSDVAFIVDGEMFLSHRALLAARSPVLKAQLLGSMADDKMPSITLHDIAPATFRVMLRFMYTDAYPEETELGDSPHEMFQGLLAAADRFALNRLKIMCAKKLRDELSVDTVASTLMCAETYNCPELKKLCIDEFFTEEKNFRKAVLTYGFAQLVIKFPSILDELREKIGNASLSFKTITAKRAAST